MKTSDLNKLKGILSSISDEDKDGISVFIEKINKELSRNNQIRGNKENLFSDCKSSIDCFLELLFYSRLIGIISKDEFNTCISMYISEVGKDCPKAGNLSDL